MSDAERIAEVEAERDQWKVKALAEEKDRDEFEQRLAEQQATLLALADEWECEPPGQHPYQHFHREACPACSRSDALRAALAKKGTGL